MEKNQDVISRIKKARSWSNKWYEEVVDKSRSLGFPVCGIKLPGSIMCEGEVTDSGRCIKHSRGKKVEKTSKRKKKADLTNIVYANIFTRCNEACKFYQDCELAGDDDDCAVEKKIYQQFYNHILTSNSKINPVTERDDIHDLIMLKISKWRLEREEGRVGTIAASSMGFTKEKSQLQRLIISQRKSLGLDKKERVGDVLDKENVIAGDYATIASNVYRIMHQEREKGMAQRHEEYKEKKKEKKAKVSKPLEVRPSI